MKYEITSKKEFQIEAAKALLADGQPHSYAEIVQHIRSQAEGTVLEGRIDYGNVWYSLRSMMEEPGSHYQKAGWGAYQKDPPQRITAEPAQDVKDGQSEIYQIMDQAVELLERFESYSSRVQGELNLTSGQETFSAMLWTVRTFAGPNISSRRCRRLSAVSKGGVNQPFGTYSLRTSQSVRRFCPRT